MTRTLSMTLAATAIALTPACAQEQIDTTSREAIEQVVYDYIIENPEIIEEALIALTEKRQLEEEQQIRDAIAENTDKLLNSSGDYSIGPADAKVTVVEFFDYRCGFCKRSASWATGLPEKYDGDVRVIFKELPILSTESEKAALAAIAAGKQGKYIEMHMGLMELDNGSGFGPEQIDQVADSVGVDVARMRADMKSVDVQKTVADSKSLARSLGITGTPNFIIGTEFVGSADITQVEALIQTALADS
ncbi:MAG: thioredoxin domain-containing protein [Hyphomonadaceae bacterium]|nr:thioredoxin domain-containing protein [Hyphomonadaceae bacterium]